MALFRRGRKNDDAVAGQQPGDTGDTGDSAVSPEDAPAERADAAASGDAGDSADSAEVEKALGADIDEAEAEERFNRARGPFDASEIGGSDTAEVERVDLGSLRVPALDGMQLRLELDAEQQSVVSAHALIGDSGVQLQAFAAPRTLGVWPDIRTEIADSVLSQGGSAKVVDGPLGRELVAGIPTRGADGRTVQAAVRFLGVDGPRWFLRAVISGPAAVDDDKAAPLVDLVRGVVVVRDDEARPPREALPLMVPASAQQADETGQSEASEAPGATGATDDPEDGAPDGPTRSADDLRPFERGPEITEVR